MKNIIPAFILLFILSGTSLYSQPATLDPYFGNGGKVTTFSGATDYGSISSMALQPDGKIVATGYTYSSITAEYYFKTARYNVDGALDTTFGTGGIVTSKIGSNDDEAMAVIIQPDGKILLSGYSLFNTNYDFAILRLKSDGSLDSTFGLNGIVVKDLGDDEFGNTMALQSNGKILISGSASNGTNQDFTILRYHSNGTIDTTFGTSGVAKIPMATAGEDIPISMKIQSNGKIVIGGFSFNTITQKSSIAIVRIDSNGTPDNTFGSSGKIVSGLNAGGDMIYSIDIQPDGKILATGQSERSSTDILLLRFTASGAPDNTFGTNGVVYSGFGIHSGYGVCVRIQPNGKILVAGNTDSIGSDFVLLRFTSAGTPDATFGTGGKVVTDISNNDVASTLIIQPDGKIIVAGVVNSNDFGLVRYKGDSAMLDGALANLMVPANKCGAMGSAQTVSVSLINNGTLVINAGAAGVSLQVSGANTGTYNKSNASAINVGANTLLIFNTVNLPNNGSNVFTAQLTLTGDVDALNNISINKDTAFLDKPIVAFSSTNASNTYNFTSNVSGRAPLTYQWTFGDNSPQSTLQNPSHHYSFVGTNSVKLIATDACGKDSTSQNITIATGINDINARNSISVFPNPANNEIKVKYTSLSANIKVSLCDVLGHIIQNTELNNGESVFNTAQLPDGVYLLKLENDVTKIFVKH